MNQQDNLLSVIKTLLSWKKTILLVCFAAGIGSIIVSLFLDNYYQSTTVFYSAHADLAKPVPPGGLLKEREYYGTDYDNDRLLSVAESDKVIDHLIKEFNLYEHYRVDSTKTKAPFKVKKKLLGLYDVKKTKFDAIEISVEDKDPIMAAAIANEARTKIEEVMRNLLHSTQFQQIKDLRSGIRTQEIEIKVLQDSLNIFRKRYGIYDPYAASELISEQLENAKSGKSSALSKLNALIELSKSNAYRIARDSILKAEIAARSATAHLDSVKSRLQMFNSGVSKLRMYEEQHRLAQEQLALSKERAIGLKNVSESVFPVLFLVAEGKIPSVKSRPRRSIIVIGSCFLALVLGTLGVLIFDRYKEVNWRTLMDE